MLYQSWRTIRDNIELQKVIYSSKSPTQHQHSRGQTNGVATSHHAHSSYLEKKQQDLALPDSLKPSVCPHRKILYGHTLRRTRYRRQGLPKVLSPFIVTGTERRASVYANDCSSLRHSCFVSEFEYEIASDILAWLRPQVLYSSVVSASILIM